LYCGQGVLDVEADLIEVPGVHTDYDGVLGLDV
jgi:hypothetical protein